MCYSQGDKFKLWVGFYSRVGFYSSRYGNLLLSPYDLIMWLECQLDLIKILGIALFCCNLLVHNSMVLEICIGRQTYLVSATFESVQTFKVHTYL